MGRIVLAVARRIRPAARVEPSAPADAGDAWFREHHDGAAREVVDFLAAGGISLGGMNVADVGCGDGITDLGIVHLARPRRLVGFDVNPVDTRHLAEKARINIGSADLPGSLQFVTCGASSLPADDGEFDVVVTWSAFEHIDDPEAVLREVHRVMKPTGVLFLQLSPFYHSQLGAHLEEWFPEGFVQFRRRSEDIHAEVRSRAGHSWWVDYKLDEFDRLNRIGLDDLGRALRRAGFMVKRLELLHHTVHLPDEVCDVDLSLLGISGVKLLAIKDARVG